MAKPATETSSIRAAAEKALAVQEIECGVQAADFPIAQMPPMPSRNFSYYIEPMFGISVVFAFGFLGIFVAQIADFSNPTMRATSQVATTLMCIWFGVALACLGILLFRSDHIERSPATCYPIPGIVAEKLNRGEILQMKNVAGPAGSLSLGTYCVRCLVWRPPKGAGKGQVHHCGVCQRCYTGFDHHCSVFGRCIAGSNLWAFYTIIAMVPMAVATAIIPVFMTPIKAVA
jgi:palmitoyltransferase